MTKEIWKKISAEDKLNYVKAYLMSEIDRHEKTIEKDIDDSLRTYCIRTIMAYKAILWLINGELFEKGENT